MNTLTQPIKIAREIKALDIDIREALKNMDDEVQDFEVDNYRFIHEDSIDEIMKDELLADEYVLGCCSAWFIVDVLDIDIEDVDAAQKAGNFTLLGRLMAKNIDEVQEKMVSYDGYGHHFNSYDATEEYINGYYIFRTN